MKQQIKQRYFIQYLGIFAILFAIIITKTSCKKNDLLTSKTSSQQQVDINKFFNLPSNINPAVAKIAAELARQNQVSGFISQIANTAGFPVWDKSTVSLLKDDTRNLNSLLQAYQSSNTCVLIPMVLDDANIVNAFIAATIINDSVTIRLYYRNDYKAYPFQANQSANGITTAEEFVSQMMLFDNAVFGYTTFQIKDKRLFHNNTVYSDTTNAKIKIELNKNEPTSSGNNLISCTEDTYTISTCTTPNAGQCSGGCDYCGFPVCWLITWTQEHCIDIHGNGGSGGWPSIPPNYPGGGGSGGDNPTGNCKVGGLILDGFAPPNPCNPPGGGNPLPPILPPINTYNPCDTLIKYAVGNDFNVMLQDLMGKLNSNKEEMYIFHNPLIPNSPNNSITLHVGQPNEFEVLPPSDNYFQGAWGLFHNHYKNQDSASLIFSAGDMEVFANIITDTSFYNVNYKRFMMGVVADSGANYILMVNNITQFRNWVTNSSVFGLENVFGPAFKLANLTQLNLPISKAETEKRFLTFLAPLGLKLFRGNSSATAWTPIKLNASGTVVETNCL